MVAGAHFQIDKAHLALPVVGDQFAQRGPGQTASLHGRGHGDIQQVDFIEHRGQHGEAGDGAVAFDHPAVIVRGKAVAKYLRGPWRGLGGIFDLDHDGQIVFDHRSQLISGVQGDHTKPCACIAFQLGTLWAAGSANISVRLLTGNRVTGPRTSGS